MVYGGSKADGIWETNKPDRDIAGVACKKKGVRIKIQPRFKIQYPMKNRGKDIRKHSYLQGAETFPPESLIIFYELL
jgi:hypothetical protein